MWLAETKDDVVDDIKSDFKVTLIVPLNDQQVQDPLDILPMLQYVLRVVLEDALHETRVPFQGLFVPCVETASHRLDKLPVCFLLLLSEFLESDEFFQDMLEDKWSESIIDESQSNADHFVGLFMLGDLIYQLVHKFLREELDLLGIEPQKEREVDVSKIDVELRLITF